MAAALVAVTALVGCTPAGSGEVAAPATPTVSRPDVSWAPRPVTRAGLSMVASTAGDRLALHTAHGDVTFWSGVNLGSTTPGHSPGELAIAREDYRRWYAQMGRLGVRVLRIYTIHPPAMYEELRAYNLAHERDPIYLVQGVYLPDESYLETGDLYAAGPTRAMSDEVRDASSAVHGDLRRVPARGRASGTWTADVSPWLAAWIVGVEVDPAMGHRSDRRNARTPEHRGRFFSSVADSRPTVPTERWLAARMDELATAEAARGTAAPIAFVNWPTTDPLRHPTEPLEDEDLLQVDANHIRPSAAWPAGTFASYHAYPYYPDFLRHEPAYQAHMREDGTKDAYAGYLAALKAHHRGMPTVITEFGVPSSLGSAHSGTNGRDQGQHTEREAMAIDADLLRVIHEEGLSGGLLFSWSDEWFKFTWNTQQRQAPVHSERRSLWHDPLTNEQWFGMLAQDPIRDGWRAVHEARSGVQRVDVDTDASWLHLRITLDRPVDELVRLGFDVVPGGLALPGATGTGPADVAVVVDPRAGSATATIRSELDPIQVDGLPAQVVPRSDAQGWSLQRLTTNRPLVQPVSGERLPAEFVEVGRLRRGLWEDPAAREYDSLATWRSEENVLLVRLPWAMLGFADPSSRTVMVPAPSTGGAASAQPRGVVTDHVGLEVRVGADGESDVAASARVTWEPWQQARFAERLKAGAVAMSQVWADVER